MDLSIPPGVFSTHTPRNGSLQEKPGLDKRMDEWTTAGNQADIDE